jgi:hypothetical protein
MRPDKQRDGQTYKTKLIIAFRNFAIAPKYNMLKSKDNLNVKLHVKHWGIFQSVLSHLPLNTAKTELRNLLCLLNKVHLGHHSALQNAVIFCGRVKS